MNTDTIRTLRERTHLGMSDCREALLAANGDLDRALEILQKKGLKKVDDVLIPLEGEVRACVGGFLIEINCQTDFGARSEDFQKLVGLIQESVLKVVFDPGVSLEDHFAEEIKNTSNALGEKIVVRRVERCGQPMGEGFLVCYSHPGGKLATVVAFDLSIDDQLGTKDAAYELGNNLAMQITAMKPLSIDRTGVPADLVEKKRAFFTEEVANKPEAARPKIIEGKLNKWFGEVCLMDQEAIWAPKTTVADHVKKIAGMKPISMLRFERGEAI